MISSCNNIMYIHVGSRDSMPTQLQAVEDTQY